jgi:uncharacterized protein
MERLIIFIRDNLRLLLGALIVIVIAALLITLVVNRKASSQVRINNQAFSVKLADSEKERQIGLSETKNLKDNEGMLFVFEEPGNYPFWMKNMKFPIDIIFINGDRVTTVIKNAQVPTTEDLEIYEPEEPSDKVLELKSGMADKYNIKTGDRIEIPNL